VRDGQRRDRGLKTSAGVLLMHRTLTVSHLSPLLDLQALSRLLGRSPATIRRDLRRNPNAVPPHMRVPGTRLLRWRESDVVAWLDAHAPASVARGAKSQGGAQ
jgi:predicted DNA-binding transcriptional regulator AlpA